MNRLTELERKLENILRPGTVAEVAGTRCRVKSGGLLTGWLPWFSQRAGEDCDWWPLEIGEQVMLLSPGGDPANGFVLAGLYSTARPAPGDNPDVRVTRYVDGTTVTYDRATHKLTANVQGDAEIVATGTAKVTAANIKLIGPVDIQGNVSVQGNVSTQGTLTNNSVNVGSTHTHPGVFSGPASTGTPQ